jgi:hypothetical protein
MIGEGSLRSIHGGGVSAMDSTQELFSNLDKIEMLVLRVTAFLGLCFFCALYLWSHLREVRNKGRPGRKRRR